MQELNLHASALGLVSHSIMIKVVRLTMASWPISTSKRIWVYQIYIRNAYYVSGYPSSQAPHFQHVHSFICRHRPPAYDNWPGASSRLGTGEPWQVRHPAGTTRMVSYSSLGFNSLTLICRRALNDIEKSDYINAVKCLQTLPSKDPNLVAAKSRFDEFHALHIRKADSVHVTVWQSTDLYLVHIAHGEFLGRVLAMA